MPLAPLFPPIGLLGRKRHGKDSVGAYLVERYGCRRRAFADSVRASLYAMDPVVRIQPDERGPLGMPLSSEIHYAPLSYLVDVHGWEDLKGVREIRRLMQAHGMAVREVLGPDAWIEATLREPLRRGDVLTDVRMPNEVLAVRRAGGLLLRVVRPGMDDGDAHVTETALEGSAVHATISNSGTLEDLGRAVDLALGEAYASAFRHLVP